MRSTQMPVTHPLLRVAVLIDGMVSLLWGVYLVAFSNRIAEAGALDNGSRFLILGAIFITFGVFFTFVVSRQSSISLTHVLYSLMPRAVILLVLGLNIFTELLNPSADLRQLETLIFVSLGSALLLELLGYYLWRRQNIAIWGYDVVGFFDDAQPIVGTSVHQYNWNNRTWFFANEDHKRKFIANPDKYALGHDGYCSFGRSFGMTFDANPKNWDILDGRLYFNSASWWRFIWKRLLGAKR